VSGNTYYANPDMPQPKVSSSS